MLPCSWLFSLAAPTLVTAPEASQLKHLLQRAISELVSVESLGSKYLRLCNRAELRPLQTQRDGRLSGRSQRLVDSARLHPMANKVRAMNPRPKTGGWGLAGES